LDDFSGFQVGRSQPPFLPDQDFLVAPSAAPPRLLAPGTDTDRGPTRQPGQAPPARRAGHRSRPVCSASSSTSMVVPPYMITVAADGRTRTLRLSG
jgi:hypothetical protein